MTPKALGLLLMKEHSKIILYTSLA